MKNEGNKHITVFLKMSHAVAVSKSILKAKVIVRLQKKEMPYADTNTEDSMLITQR